MVDGNKLSFHALTNTSARVKIVDIGANPLGDPPYATLLRSGNADLVGFEPNREALDKLNAEKGPFETYLPYAVGDGGRHTLHFCFSSGMTSLLEPNPDVLKFFSNFINWGAVLSTEEIDTIRLDDIPETAGADFIKMDIQGAELMVLQNAKQRLADALVVQAEVEFLPMYKNQPLFSDVEKFMRECGFVLHHLDDIQKRTILPLMVNNSLYSGINQLLWADAIFVRDFTKIDNFSDDQLLSASAIVHDCYKSFDLAFHLLGEYDRRTGKQIAQSYLSGLTA